MAQFDYPTLVSPKATPGSIKYFVGHEMVDPDLVLTEAQAYIYERVRTWEMRATAAFTILADADHIDLPVGWQEFIKIRVNGFGVDDVQFVHGGLLPRERDQDGALFIGPPDFCGIEDGALVFSTRMDRAYAGNLVFYQRPPVLSVANPTNWLTTRFPTLLRRACLMYGYEQRKRMQDFNEEVLLVDKAILDVNIAEDLSRRNEVHR